MGTPVVRSLRWGIPTVLVVLVGLAALLLWQDARAATRHMGVVEAELAAARAAFVGGELEQGREHVGAADVAVQQAATRTDGVLWRLGSVVPRYGASARTARISVDLAAAAVTLAAQVGERADVLLEQGAAAFVGDDGQVRTTELRQVGAQLDELPVEELASALDRLAAEPEAGLIGSLPVARARAVDLADDVLGTLDRARGTLRALSGFLGGQGDRTYLLGVQNPGELRGTGGLLSYLAELRVRDGRLAIESAGVTASDDPNDLVGRARETGNTLGNLEPVDRPPAFADRYDHIAGGAVMQSVNADPDLPTVAPVLMELYAERSGRAPVDGVVLVDPVFLAHILDATGGPIRVPAELVAEAPGIPTTLTADNIVETLTVTVYDAFGGSNPARRVFDEAVTLAVLERLTSGQWDPVELTHALADAAAGRHLQLYSTVESEQAAFVDLGIAGRMPNEERGLEGDLLAVTAINAAANKQDTLVAHRISGDISLGALRDSAPPTSIRSAELQVSLDNPVEPGRDTYISGSAEPRAVGSPPTERRDDALNRTWFSLWTPPITEVRTLTEDGEQQSFRATNIHGHRVFDYFLETPSQESNSFTMDLEGRVDLQRDGDAVVYELTLWRQAKAIPDHWDLTISAPPGWEVAEAEVTGGGAPLGLGVGGDDGQPITAEVQDGVAHVQGAVTRDATIQVQFLRG